MEYTLIPTKLQPPRVRSDLVSRPSLITQLNRGLDRKLTLITAPAGFGKTTLVVDWLGQLDRPSAWLSLDRSDNDPSLFLSYFVAAIQSCFADSCANTIQLLQSADLPHTNILVATLLNDLFVLPGQFVLVLDDYHLIQETTIQQLVNSLLERLPTSIHLVFISRADPMMPLPRLRVEQQLMEIRTETLRFSNEEAQRVLQLGKVGSIDAATASLLNQRIEGWVVGLRLAALSLSESSQQQWLQDFQQPPNEFITDYLFMEVLSQQSPAIQNFLLNTSILDRFSSDLCQALLEDGDVSNASQQIQAIIAELLRANLFIVPLDEQNGWYRYHHLFQQMLQQKLTRQKSKVEIEVTHQRASLWLSEQGFTEEALDHALAANDMDTAVAIVEDNSHNFLNGLERRTMERWMASLPEEVVWSRPKLLVTKAWLLYRHWRFNALDILLDRLQEILDYEGGLLNQGEKRFILGHLHSLRSVTSFHLYLDYAQTIANCEKAVQLLPPSEGGSLSTAMFHLAFALIGLGETDSATNYLQEIIHDPNPSGPAEMQARLGLGNSYFMAGDLVSMEQLVQRLLYSAKETSAPGHWLAGMLMFEQNQLEKAQAHFEIAVHHRHLTNYLAGFYSWLGLIRIKQIQGLLPEAQENINDLHADCARLNHSSFLRVLEILQGYQRLLEGDSVSARQWALAYKPELKPDSLFLIDAPDLIWSRILLITGDDDDRRTVLRYLKRCLAPLLNTQFIRRKIQLLTHMAAAHIALDQESLALEHLQKALLLAQPGSIVRSFADAGPSLIPSLQLCQTEGVAAELIPQIMASFSQSAPRPTMAVATLLTQRELEILRLMQDGLSNKDIALTLVISLHTAKRHASNIYSKLGVNGRQEAIFHAQELGLLQQKQQDR